MRNEQNGVFQSQCFVLVFTLDLQYVTGTQLDIVETHRHPTKESVQRAGMNG